MATMVVSTTAMNEARHSRKSARRLRVVTSGLTAENSYLLLWRFMVLDRIP
jgi:hypothetical protein